VAVLLKVTLINPPDPNSIAKDLDPSLGLMYLSSFLKNHNVECEILDFALHDKSEWLSLIKSHKSDLYGLTVYSSSVSTADIINKLIKSVHPESKIIWGATHASYEWISSFIYSPELDFIALGEGEETLLELCRNSDGNYNSIAGLANRDGQSMFISNLRPLIKNIDELPLPDRTIDLHQYTRKVDGVPSTPIMTSRGCSYNCLFCCSRYFWKYPRFHSFERVKTELNIIKEQGFNAVHCWDDTFTLNHERLYKILDEIKRLKFTFRCNGDLRLDTKEVLQKLYESGCREYAVGIESGDQQVLNAINKRTTVERNKQVMKWAKEVGLPIKAYLMVGNVGETMDSIKKTIDFIKQTGPEYYTISNFVPMPGCQIYSQPEKYGIKFRTKNWDEYFVVGRKNQGGCVIDTKEMTAEQIAEAREMLIAELPKQTGKLQDYYKKVS